MKKIKVIHCNRYDMQKEIDKWMKANDDILIENITGGGLYNDVAICYIIYSKRVKL